jgi:cation diffusion facilitator family transporter
MLAEAAHSAADTLNQGFLLASVHPGDRPADRDHQFGYGQERYFWSLLAAFGIFIAGGGFSIFEGILALTRAGSENPAVAYAALAVAFAAEGTSLIRAYRQVRGEARNEKRTMLNHMQTSPDTKVKTALFEDSAAIIGLIFAAAGVGLRQLTGSPAWDGGASIAIGILLIAVAVKLGLNSRDLLIGRAADPRDQRLIRDQIAGMRGVDSLLELQTMHVGPDSLIVAARVALNDAITADQVEDLAGDIDRRLADKLPQDLHVFVDPTQTPEANGRAP